jgi:GT2 family glycosyltransferase
VERLTLSIVSHGHGELLARLLHDLAALPGLEDAQVLVTLNIASEDLDVRRFDPLRVQLLRNERPQGFGANHNAAFAHCRTPWFAILNPDLCMSRNPFPALLDAAARWPDAAVLSPRVVGPEGRAEDSVRTNLSPLSLLNRRVLGRRAPHQADAPSRQGSSFYWVAGMFMLVRADAFRAVGGFDERFFMYCEDYDLCARLYNAGYAIAVEERAEVTHAAQRDSHRSAQHLRWHLASLARVWTSRAFWKVALSR